MGEEKMRLGDALGARVPVRIGGDEYFMSPPTLDDLAEAEKWLESRAVEGVKQRIKDHGADLTDAERLSILANAIETAAEVSRDSVDSTRYMAFVSLRHNHQDLTLEQVSKMISMRDLREINRVLDSFSTTPLEGDGDSGEA